MIKLVFSLLATAAVASIPSVASAAPYITIATGSGTFGNNDLTCAVGSALPCTFSDTITFTTPVGYNLASATISSTMAGTDMTTNVDFTSVMLNGVNFNIGTTGYVEFRSLLNQNLVAGATNTLMVAGTTGGNGSYGGSLVFTEAAAVPEPASWALMILGFGVTGYSMRRRRSVRLAHA